MLKDFGNMYGLHLTHKTGYSLLCMQAQKVSMFYDVNVEMDDGLNIGEGVTRDGINSDGSIHIGNYGIHQSFMKFFQKMPDRMFVAGLVSIYHEARHAELFLNMQKTDVSSELVYAHLAKQGNMSYYLCDGNRYKYTTEIDAEYNGVISAYNILVSLVRQNQCEVSADDLICDFVNYQCEEMSYYIKQPDGKPFTSISEIDDAFQEAYEKATSHEPVKRDLAGRVVSDGAYREFRTSWHGDDAVKFVTLQNGRVRPEKQYIVDQIWDASNYDKDRMIAAITLHMHPEYGQFYYGLDTDGLSLDCVFKQSEDDASLFHNLESEFE